MMNIDDDDDDDDDGGGVVVVMMMMMMMNTNHAGCIIHSWRAEFKHLASLGDILNWKRGNGCKPHICRAALFEEPCTDHQGRIAAAPAPQQTPS